MTASYTISTATSFTLTHAKHLGSKVATDLKRMQRLYGSPTDQQISQFETEFILLTKDSYLESVIYGFKRAGEWVEPALIYSPTEAVGSQSTDDDPGKIRPGANTAGASFASYLTYTRAWSNLTEAQRAAIEADVPVKRTAAAKSPIAGALERDKTYSAGGRSVERTTVRAK